MAEQYRNQYEFVLALPIDDIHYVNDGSVRLGNADRFRLSDVKHQPEIRRTAVRCVLGYMNGRFTPSTQDLGVVFNGKGFDRAGLDAPLTEELLLDAVATVCQWDGEVAKIQEDIEE